MEVNEAIRAVKLVGEDGIEGLGMPFGGPFNGKDLDGERFTDKTDFAFDWFAERPLLYQHGLEDGTGISVVGRVKSWELKADLGVWVQAQLDKSHEYFGAVKELITKGKLFFSSGAMRHLVETNSKTGEIKRWPWVELSLTPTPSNLLAQVEMAVASKHFEMAGLKMADMSDDLKAVWSAAQVNDLDDSCFAYIEPGGNKDEDGKTVPRSLRHFPYRDADGKLDEAHIRNALGRIPQSDLPQDAKDKALRIIRRAAEEVGIEMAEEKAVLVSALVIADADDLEKIPFTKHADLVADFAASLTERTKDLNERRLKEGRVLSSASKKRLAASMDAMASAIDELRAFLDDTTPEAKAEALERQKRQLEILKLYQIKTGV